MKREKSESECEKLKSKCVCGKGNRKADSKEIQLTEQYSRRINGKTQRKDEMGK